MLGVFSQLILSAALSFGSPVNYPISLAGNFGEPRPNHFHGGIDVRTGMVEGKPVFSVADGYVSRITVGLGGFGNATGEQELPYTYYYDLTRIDLNTMRAEQLWQMDGEQHRLLEHCRST